MITFMNFLEGGLYHKTNKTGFKLNPTVNNYDSLALGLDKMQDGGMITRDDLAIYAAKIVKSCDLFVCC